MLFGFSINYSTYLAAETNQTVKKIRANPYYQSRDTRFIQSKLHFLVLNIIDVYPKYGSCFRSSQYTLHQRKAGSPTAVCIVVVPVVSIYATRFEGEQEKVNSLPLIRQTRFSIRQPHTPCPQTRWHRTGDLSSPQDHGSITKLKHVEQKESNKNSMIKFRRLKFHQKE